jgi:hypothetical protein
VTPGAQVYGVAGYDGRSGEARAIFGKIGGASENTKVEFRHLDQAARLASKGGAVHVEAERIGAADTSESTPERMITGDYPASEQTLVITLREFGPGDAYTVILRAPQSGE